MALSAEPSLAAISSNSFSRPGSARPSTLSRLRFRGADWYLASGGRPRGRPGPRLLAQPCIVIARLLRFFILSRVGAAGLAHWDFLGRPGRRFAGAGLAASEHPDASEDSCDRRPLAVKTKASSAGAPPSPSVSAPFSDPDSEALPICSPMSAAARSKERAEVSPSLQRRGCRTAAASGALLFIGGMASRLACRAGEAPAVMKERGRPRLRRLLAPLLFLGAALLFGAVLRATHDLEALELGPTSPVLAVIVPCYNCERWVAETLHALGQQTFKNFTLVLVDDGSRAPMTAGAVRAMYGGDTRVLRHYRNMGLSAARNTGAMAARASRFIVFLDPDDLIEPTALEKMLLRLMNESTSGCVFVYPAVVHFEARPGAADRAVIGIEKADFSHDRLLGENYIPSFALLERSFYMAAGGMCQAHIRYWEDYDFWLRLTNLGFEGALLPEPLFWYRRHDAGRSSAITRAVQKEQWMDELVRNNPCDLMDMAEDLLRDPRWVPPCYFALEDDRWSLLARLHRWPALLSRWRPRKARRTSAFEALRNYERPQGSTLVNRLRAGRPTILFIVPWLQVGGADTYDLHVMHALRDRFRILVLTEIAGPHPAEAAFAQVAQEVFHLPTLIDDLHPGHEPAVSRIIQYFVESRSIRHVYCRNAAAGYRAFRYLHDVGLKRRLDIKFYDVQHLHTRADDGGWEHTTVPYHYLIDRRLVASEDFRQRQVWLLQKAYRYSNDHDDTIEVLSPPVDLDVWAPQRYPDTCPAAQDPGLVTVLFVGRVDEQKDPLRWLAVASELVQDLDNLRFLMIGDGPLLAQVRHEAQGLPLNMRLTGAFLPAAEVAAYMRYGLDRANGLHCRRGKVVLLLTSSNEGLPTVVLEAVAMGVPVVTPDVGAMREVADAAGGLVHVCHDLVEGVKSVLWSHDFAHDREPGREFVRRFGAAAFNQRIRDIIS